MTALQHDVADLTTAGAAVSIRGVSKYYGSFAAVDDVSLEIEPGSFVTLLGASGSGKTTLLRILAGFLDASSGAIELDGRDLTRVPVHKREIGMVFQNYALFPHMTVQKNVEFPLARRRVPRADRPRLIAEALEAVELTGFERRMPTELSGGQQQRVALARAIVAKPRLLLMDEPLGALDRRLREALQVQIRQLSHELGLTVINVTHDQEEALTMSDRIALLAGGRLVQYGTPYELYARPGSEVAARFLGESNIFSGVPRQRAGLWEIDVAGESVRLPDSSTDPVPGEQASVFIRPHRMHVAPAGSAPAGEDRCTVTGRVAAAIYAGDSCKLHVELEQGDPVVVRADSELLQTVATGDRVEVSWRRTDALLLARS
ncbi:ABC transporter ATP-binding protein [Herbiconiux moechotypicola]|uniref:ABC transporter ATP-binding protein n=1 Tax=Herbiconiux moechotypicola TaxID=637393 RepID=A0ABP5QFD9_9MICO|nr:ABC transporter ATP-binding protein [Herbiconiux moechotypicola]MCS5730002.1 ABC transporter ATP-binding protein [Herbiconiux moechotypicola]